MSDNLMNLYFKQQEDQLNYHNAFENLLSKQGLEEKMVANLTEQYDTFKREEEKFYRFFGATDYDSFNKKISDNLKKIDSDFLEDYKRLTNTGITGSEEIYKAISAQGTYSQKLVALDKDIYNKVKQEFINTFMFLTPLDENGDLDYTYFGKDLFKRFDGDPFIEVLSSRHGNFEKDFIQMQMDISNKISQDLGDFFDKSFSKKKQIAVSVDDIRGNIFEIYAKRMEEYVQKGGLLDVSISVKTKDKQTLFSLGTGKNIIKTMGRGGAIPNITIGRELKENISKHLPQSSSSGSSTKNPVLQKSGAFKKQYGDKWISKLTDAEIDTLNKEIFIWLEEELSLKTVDYFKSLLKTDKKLYIRAFTSPAGVVGLLGEIMGTRLFSLLVEGASTDVQEGTVENIGGNIEDRTAEKLSKIDAYRAGKQPPVDILIGLINEKEKTSFGIQSKHSFSYDAQTRHQVSFINAKSIDQVFSEDLGGLPPEIQKKFNVELIPLLQGYFGNSTINSYLSGEKSGLNLNIEPAINIINKIFSFFIDLTMDLGAYQSFQEGVAHSWQERNIFLLYLGEFFIPASEIIAWVLGSLGYKIDGRKLTNSENITSVRNASKKDKMSEITNLLIEKGVSQVSLVSPRDSLEQNLISNIKIEVSTKFLEKNLEAHRFIK